MRYIPSMQEMTRDHGTQPLDQLMDRWGLNNHDLVEASIEQLSHKQVQKARKGRQLTLKMMQKLARTLNDAVFTRLPKDQRDHFVPYLHRNLFNYAKGHDPAWQDPNEPLQQK